MVSIEVEYLFPRNIEIIDFQLLRKQVDKLLQLFSRRGGTIFLDLDKLYPKLWEDELADVEIGLMIHQHLLVNEAGIASIRADDLHEL